MNNDEIENKKNELNKEIRNLLSIIDVINGEKNDYPNYLINTLNQDDYLNQQISLVITAENKLKSIFRD